MVFVRDSVVLVHDLKTMLSFTVFVRDRAVLVHDLKTMVSFTVFVKDRAGTTPSSQTSGMKPGVIYLELPKHKNITIFHKPQK
jgi:hypothetical protein